LLLEFRASLIIVLEDLAVLKLSLSAKNALVVVLFVDEAEDVVGDGKVQAVKHKLFCQRH